MPETITIDGLTVEDANAPGWFEGVLLVQASNNGRYEPYPYQLTKRIFMSEFKSKMPYVMANEYIKNQIQVVNR